MIFRAVDSFCIEPFEFWMAAYVFNDFGMADCRSLLCRIGEICRQNTKEIGKTIEIIEKYVYRVHMDQTRRINGRALDYVYVGWGDIYRYSRTDRDNRKRVVQNECSLLWNARCNRFRRDAWNIFDVIMRRRQ